MASSLHTVLRRSPLIKKPVEAEAAPSAAAAQAGTGELIAWLRDRGSRLEGIEVASSGQVRLSPFVLLFSASFPVSFLCRSGSAHTPIRTSRPASHIPPLP